MLVVHRSTLMADWAKHLRSAKHGRLPDSAQCPSKRRHAISGVYPDSQHIADARPARHHPALQAREGACLTSTSLVPARRSCRNWPSLSNQLHMKTLNGANTISMSVEA